MLQGPLALNQVLIVEVVVPYCQTAICKGALLEGESLVANAVRALPDVHKKRELTQARFGLTVRLGRFRLNRWPNSYALLDAATFNCFALIT
jgi:hypothetical protein